MRSGEIHHSLYTISALQMVNDGRNKFNKARLTWNPPEMQHAEFFAVGRAETTDLNPIYNPYVA
jgi:hypothetical protein